jgi:hypothetical protein
MMARRTFVVAQVMTGLVGLDPGEPHLDSALRAGWALSQLRLALRKFRLILHGYSPQSLTAKKQQRVD